MSSQQLLSGAHYDSTEEEMEEEILLVSFPRFLLSRPPSFLARLLQTDSLSSSEAATQTRCSTQEEGRDWSGDDGGGSVGFVGRFVAVEVR